MSDPRPVLWLLALQLLALAGYLGWWILQPPERRFAALLSIQRHEQVHTAPPVALREQAQWLVGHRVEQLRGMRLLGIVALLIGAGEGMARRRRDVLGGYLLRSWTLGVCLLPLVVGGIGVYLILPIVLPVLVIGMAFSVLLAVAGYGLLSGRPAVS